MIYECICLSIGYVCSTIHIFNPLSSNQLLLSLRACDLLLVGADSVDTRRVKKKNKKVLTGISDKQIHRLD